VAQRATVKESWDAALAVILNLLLVVYWFAMAQLIKQLLMLSMKYFLKY
jgi:hypothetical protein